MTDSLPTAATSASRGFTRARSNYHVPFAHTTRLRPPLPDLRDLYRKLWEKALASQVAAEMTTQATWEVVRLLRRMREERGWTPEYMAKLISVELRTIHRIEQEVQLPKPSTLRDMIEAFGYQVPMTPILFTSKPSQANIKKGTRRK